MFYSFWTLFAFSRENTYLNRIKSDLKGGFPAFWPFNAMPLTRVSTLKVATKNPAAAGS